jgi:DNA-3-methyladenine glycosylase II
MKTPAQRQKALAHLKQADPALGKLIDKVGAYTLTPDELHDVYGALARSIIYQQLNGRAAATIWGRVAALGASGFPTPPEVLALETAVLRGAGLSGNKEKALRDLATRAHAGELPTIDEAHALEDAVLIERLTKVRGIGPWTVEMMLMFRLGRADVLPATDYGVRQGFMRTFRTKTLPSPKEILARGERWRPYRSVAAWYLWRALELPTKAAPTPKVASTARTKVAPRARKKTAAPARKKAAPSRKKAPPSKKAPRRG